MSPTKNIVKNEQMWGMAWREKSEGRVVSDSRGLSQSVLYGDELSWEGGSAAFLVACRRIDLWWSFRELLRSRKNAHGSVAYIVLIDRSAWSVSMQNLGEPLWHPWGPGSILRERTSSSGIEREKHRPGSRSAILQRLRSKESRPFKTKFSPWGRAVCRERKDIRLRESQEALR